MLPVCSQKDANPIRGSPRLMTPLTLTHPLRAQPRRSHWVGLGASTDHLRGSQLSQGVPTDTQRCLDWGEAQDWGAGGRRPAVCLLPCPLSPRQVYACVLPPRECGLNTSHFVWGRVDSPSPSPAVGHTQSVAAADGGVCEGSAGHEGASGAGSRPLKEPQTVLHGNPSTWPLPAAPPPSLGAFPPRPPGSPPC